MQSSYSFYHHSCYILVDTITMPRAMKVISTSVIYFDMSKILLRSFFCDPINEIFNRILEILADLIVHLVHFFQFSSSCRQNFSLPQLKELFTSSLGQNFPTLRVFPSQSFSTTWSISIFYDVKYVYLRPLCSPKWQLYEIWFLLLIAKDEFHHYYSTYLIQLHIECI